TPMRMAAARTRATSTRCASPPASSGEQTPRSATASASISGNPILSAPDADLAALPRLPRDAAGPVFAEPWQAQAFALAVELSAAGVFSWPEWAAALGAELASDPDDDGGRYYDHWVAALERLVAGG